MVTRSMRAKSGIVRSKFAIICYDRDPPVYRHVYILLRRFRTRGSLTYWCEADFPIFRTSAYALPSNAPVWRRKLVSDFLMTEMELALEVFARMEVMDG